MFFFSIYVKLTLEGIFELKEYNTVLAITK